MTYQEAIQYIEGTGRFGSILGLGTIKELLMRIGDPHKQLKFVHIAGTNGKGSVSAMTAQILQEAGYKVGLYTSPYLFEFEERIRVGGEKIEKKTLAALTETVKKAADDMIKQGAPHPTEFELITALAMLYFLQQQVDIVVLEVGLGGRLDATNIIERAEVSVICSISLDHTQVLGDTIEKIAAEKAGIIKENACVVVDRGNSSSVIEVIEKKAKEKKATVYLSPPLEMLQTSLDGTVFRFENDVYELSLLGEHQLQNAGIVLQCMEVLREKGYRVTGEHEKRGLKTCKWPCRFEVVSKNPILIMDGAHNPAGMRTLVKGIKTYLPDKKVTAVFGMLGDKEYAACTKLLCGAVDAMYTFTVDSPRALPAEELKDEAKHYIENVHAAKNERDAVEKALRQGQDGAIVAAGSLYAMKKIKQAFSELQP